jgi:hypothetical protein
MSSTCLSGRAVRSRRSHVLAITQRKFGGPEVLEIQNVDRPTGLPTEVIVRVNAVGLNSIDADVRSGVSPVLGQPPFTLGWDISGVVDEIVPGSTGSRLVTKSTGCLSSRGRLRPTPNTVARKERSSSPSDRSWLTRSWMRISEETALAMPIRSHRARVTSKYPAGKSCVPSNHC